MVLRHKTPIAAVCRIVAVVTHHPVVVHLEGVLLRLLTIDKDSPVLDLQVVTLINLDGTLVDGNIIHRQGYLLTFLRNPDGSVIVSRPVLIAIQRIDFQIVGIRIQSDRLHKIFPTLQYLYCTLCQWQITHRVQTRQVLHRDAQFLHQLLRQRLFQPYIIGILHVLRLLIGLTVQVNDMVLDLQRLSRQSNTAFHVVLSTISRTCNNLAILHLILSDGLSSCLIDGIKVLHSHIC